MITLGMMDQDVRQNLINDYFDDLKKLTRRDWRNKGLKHEATGDFRPFEKFIPNVVKPIPELSISEVQTILKDIGFFPHGKIDGICGYRTLSAIRLFQEYVRSIDKNPAMTSDGLAGGTTFKHLGAWKNAGRKADWTETVNTWQNWVDQGNTVPQNIDTEYAHWLRFLNDVKRHYTEKPNLMLDKVKKISGPSTVDTLDVSNWDFSPGHIHMVGIRRKSSGGLATFNDVLLLLINGMVFKFLGSTDPGSTVNANGFPFLVQGQHKYHFGWHNISRSSKTHLALKPLHASPGQGVLVVRAIPPELASVFSHHSKAGTPKLPRQHFKAQNFELAEAVLHKDLEPNHTINIHWAGAGLNDGSVKTVTSWSEGCQVITGGGYINHQNQVIDCRKFAALGNNDVGKKMGGIRKTRAAYNVLLDLVSVFGSKQGNEVRYMLLVEDDIVRDQNIAQIFRKTQQEVLGTLK